MPAYYFDTSALFKRYRTERGTDVIEELFSEKSQREVFVTSYLTMLEVTSVATRALRSGRLIRRAYDVILGSVSRDVNDAVALQSISDRILSDSLGLTQLHVLRAPDAIYLATALRVQAINADGNLYFLASDARLKAAAENSGLAVLDPEDMAALDTLRASRR